MCSRPKHDKVAALKVQLLDQNGGAPEADVIVSVAGREEELFSFFGVGMKDEGTEIAGVAKTLDGRLPPRTTSVRGRSGRNLFVVETNATSGHPVWFWDHELEGESGALTPVSASFDDFLSGLLA